MGKRQSAILLSFILIALIAINYPFLDKTLEGFLDTSQSAIVERVIDGDTIVIQGTSQSVRLLGINAPERGEPFYNEAKAFLEEIAFNETVTLEFVGAREDKYKRILAYVHLNQKNINLEIVKNGLANYYFYSGRDKHSNDLEEAWQECLEKEVNLCQPSQNPCASCLSIDANFIANSCPFNCNINNWTIKGEGRERFAFNGSLMPRQTFDFSLDLENSGGSLFLRDEKGLLASWKKFS